MPPRSVPTTRAACSLFVVSCTGRAGMSSTCDCCTWAPLPRLAETHGVWSAMARSRSGLTPNGGHLVSGTSGLAGGCPHVGEARELHPEGPIADADLGRDAVDLERELESPRGDVANRDVTSNSWSLASGRCTDRSPSTRSSMSRLDSQRLPWGTRARVRDLPRRGQGLRLRWGPRGVTPALTRHEDILLRDPKSR